MPDEQAIAAASQGRSSVRKEGMRIEQLQEALARMMAENTLRGLLVVQHRIDGESYDTLARQHGLSRDQVKRRLRDGMRRLRELMRDPAVSEDS